MKIVQGALLDIEMCESVASFSFGISKEQALYFKIKNQRKSVASVLSVCQALYFFNCLKTNYKI
jgi:hypothetical protein